MPHTQPLHHHLLVLHNLSDDKYGYRQLLSNSLLHEIDAKKVTFSLELKSTSAQAFDRSV
jgi:hypothetical protein